MSPILLVEDNPDDETLTLRALEKQGISDHVVVARDGAEALDYLFGTGLYAGREVSEIPRLILLDLKLAKIDGLDVLRRLRGDRRTQMIPVVILTSSNEAADRLASYRLCANSYVRKPVDFDQFFDALRHIVTYWLRLNEPPPTTRDLR
jgi:two-component system response regulator